MHTRLLDTCLLAAIDQVASGFMLLDADSQLLYCNRFILQHSPRAAEQLLGRPFCEAFPEADTPRWHEMFQAVLGNGQPRQTFWHEQPYLIRLNQPEDSAGPSLPMLQATLLYRIDCPGQAAILGLAIFDNSKAAANPALQQALAVLDSKHSELQALSDKLQLANRQLLQSEKMAAIGQLAAGVAHEINNPVGFVASNLKTLAGYVQQLLQLIEALDQDAPGEREALKREHDYAFIREDICSLLEESGEGVDRVRKIIASLRDFSHSGDDSFAEADLHEGIESTLNVVNNEIKYKAQVIRAFGDLPRVECISTQINQVIMNLLVNAAQAIDGFGRIVIRTGRSDAQRVFIEVQDSGCGIPEQLQAQIFDPFFTTKPVGKGTGLGLALSYNIVEKHHGSLTVCSTPGQGATFRLLLPIRQPGSTHTGDDV